MGGGEYVGKLLRTLYGTRDAPKRWEAFLCCELVKHGFVQGKASACCFYHPSRNIRCVVHGDDFVFAGSDKDLDWTTARMKESFLIKLVGRHGGGAQDDKELRILNRVVRWTSQGLL